MSDYWGPPWSNNPYAPQIPYWLYTAEKTNFAGFLIGAIFYGIVVVLFFQCMDALLNPVDPVERNIRWGFVAHTFAMFTFVTIFTAINLDIQSISYIDNRDFPGDDLMFPPGPIGYQFFIFAKAISVVPTVMFFLNTYLADGLLLYRCYITYAKNLWVIAFPCLMFLGSFAMGVAYLWQSSQANDINSDSVTLANFGTPFYAISISLNVILTLMIIARLLLHRRNVRNAMTRMGAPASASGLYRTAITMLIESCALYAVSYLLFIGPWATGSPISNIFLPILAETQVIAPFLITLRVAKRTALTTEATGPLSASSIRFGTRRESMGGTINLSAVHPTSSMDVPGKITGELGIGVDTTSELNP